MANITEGVLICSGVSPAFGPGAKSIEPAE